MTITDVRRSVSIQVHTKGRGSPVLMIPSLGRGVEDYDRVAGMLAEQGYQSIMPEPRGIGGSSGPLPQTLFDLAQDAATACRHLGLSSIDVVGHAFGNRVARALATQAPDLVKRVVLLAGGGQTVIDADIRAALMGSLADGTKPDNERLKDLQMAFFHAQNDPAIWLRGWHSQAADMQLAASDRTDTARWWTAGRATVLLVQAEADPVAPAGNADALAEAIGDRLTRVLLRRASHAILPEQPVAVAALIADYLSGETDGTILQDRCDHFIV